MPTYHEIMSTDLATLTTAAERWDAMAGEFEKQETAYRREVRGVSTGRSWTGLSADAAHARFDITLKEFQYAQTEAKAVAALLRDAHQQFVELRGRVDAARRGALAAGMRVSEAGVVSADAGSVAKAAGTHGAPAGDARCWQERLDRAVRAVTDADTGVRIALTAVVTDSDVIVGGRGFNGRATGDIERYEAQAVEGVLGKLGRGQHLSRGELLELERLLRDNGDDEVFARTVLDGLGAGGTIRLTNELNDVIHGPTGDRSGDYSTIEQGLAGALATATRDTKSTWYRAWRAGMRKAGVRRYATEAQGLHLDKALGYQSLVTLMAQGKGHGYAPAMLEDLTDDMITAERREPGIWQLKTEYGGRRGGWFANDPVDGMLGLMSHSPDTAAHYLNSGDHMEYLMKERDWNVVLHEHDGPKASGYCAGPDTDDRAGFGAALQAGATGIDPADKHAHFVAHGKANEAVFRSAFGYLADTGDDFPPSLRRPMANVLVNYGDTVHAAMSEVDIAHSPLKQEQLFEVVKQVSKDEGAYGVLNGGLNHSIVADIHRDHSHTTDSLTRAGRTVGFLEEARVQAAGDPKTAEFATKPFFDKAISYLPVGSGDVQTGFDYVTERWLADEQKRLDDRQSGDNIQKYSERNGQLMALAGQWKKTHGVGEDPYFNPKQEISRSARDGMAQAAGMSGERVR